MSLDQLVARLESATTRLEALAAGGAGSAQKASSSSSDSSSSEILSDFDEILSHQVKAFVDASQKIGGEVQEAADIFHRAFKAQREFIGMVAKSKKPADSALPQLVKPTADLISQAQDFRDKNRGKKEFFNHLSAISEGIPGLGWVMVSPKPGPYVVQMKEAAEFYTNRVLKEGDDVHKAWARTFPAVFNELANYVKKHHTTGLVWNPKGGEVSAAAPAPAPAPAASSPSPSSAPAPGGGDKAGLFAALNKGGDITSGLKKVDKSQMTHKNPELRNTGPVPAGTSSSPAPKTPASAPKAEDKPPKLAQEGNKWNVEYQKNAQGLVIEVTEAKQSIYVYKCTGSTLVVKGKVNQITLDACKKTAVVCENVISSVDTVNCQSCQVQITGKAPTISIDKTDGLVLYLSKEGLDTQIMTSKSSEINVSTPGATEDSDPVETPLPEQFKTSYEGGKWVTTIVEHKG